MTQLRTRGNGLGARLGVRADNRPAAGGEALAQCGLSEGVGVAAPPNDDVFSLEQIGEPAAEHEAAAGLLGDLYSSWFAFVRFAMRVGLELAAPSLA